jgi:hypothetical protein
MGERSKSGTEDRDRAAEETRTLVRHVAESLRPSAGQAEQSAAHACPSCRVKGRVEVEAFRWDSERHLNWSCHACGMTWTTMERRGQDR